MPKGTMGNGDLHVRLISKHIICLKIIKIIKLVNMLCPSLMMHKNRQFDEILSSLLFSLLPAFQCTP